MRPQQAGIVMRVMGPLALHYYFPEQIDLYARLERLGDRYFTDIDYAAYGKNSGKMPKFMETLGYECDLQTMMSSGKTRHIYYGGPVPMIDVFFDKLDYCHEVIYKDRLELDPYSVSLADIMLQKLQIWEINDKDLKDIEYLLTTAEIGDDDEQEDQPVLHRQALRRRLGLLVHGHHQLRPGQGARRQRRRPSPPSSGSTSRTAATSSWRASRPSPRPRPGTSAPRRAPSKLWYNTGFSDW